MTRVLLLRMTTKGKTGSACVAADPTCPILNLPSHASQLGCTFVTPPQLCPSAVIVCMNLIRQVVSRPSWNPTSRYFCTVLRPDHNNARYRKALSTSSPTA